RSQSAISAAPVPSQLRQFVRNRTEFWRKLLPQIQGSRGILPGMKTIQRFIKDESGATAIEYGLIAAGIALAIIAAVNGLGTKLNTKFTNINASIK
ncbi:Flp family type IVb pilin, partial [Xanthomonas oryzae]